MNFSGIRARLQLRLERLRLGAALALLNLIKPTVAKLGPQRETHDREIGEEWELLHKQALFTNVGMALSQSAAMEDLLVGIASLLLRTHEVNKVGTVMYSIISFPVWLNIIDELFSLEPLYNPLKPKWNKLSNRIRGLKETRDRLAHHTIYQGDKPASLAGDPSLRPSQYDLRQKSQKYQPLNYNQISEFIDAVDKIRNDLRELRIAMTALLSQETSQKKSSDPSPDQRQP